MDINARICLFLGLILSGAKRELSEWVVDLETTKLVSVSAIRTLFPVSLAGGVRKTKGYGSLMGGNLS